MGRKNIKAGSLYFDIIAKTEKIQKDIAQAKQEIVKETKKIERGLRGIQKETDKTAKKLGDMGKGKAKKGFDGINLSVKELKLRLIDLDAKMKRLSATTGLSVEALSKVGGGRTKIAFQSIQREIESTKLQINKLAAASKNAAKHMHSSGNRIKNMFKMMAIRMAAFYVVLRGARAALNFTKEAKNAARDALETQTKFEQVFYSIRTEAEITAKALALSFGLANTTARELLGNTGDLLVGFGFTEKKSLELAKQMVTLAGDLSSFKNISGGVPKVLNLMISAMSGITQASKAVGVVISQRDKDFMKLVATLQKTKGLTFQQARALAVLNEFFKQSKVAVGDYQRTKDNLANTERRLNEEFLQLKITLGRELTPVFLGATRAALGLLRAFTDDAMDKAIRKLTELGVKGKELEDILKFRDSKNKTNNLEEAKLNLKKAVDYAKEVARMNDRTTVPILMFMSKNLKGRIKLTNNLKDSVAKLTEERIKNGTALTKEEQLQTFILNIFKEIVDAQKNIIDLEKEKNKKVKETNDNLKKTKIVSVKEVVKKIELQRTLRELNNNITSEFIDNAKNELRALLKTNDKIEDRIILLQELKKLNKEFSQAEDYIFRTGGNLLKSPKGAPDKLTPGEKIIAARGKTDYGSLGDNMKEVNGNADETKKSLLDLIDTSAILRGGFEEAGRTIAQAFGNAITLFKNANSVLQQFLNTLIKSIAQMFIMAAISKGLKLWNPLGLFSAAKGGEFVGTNTGVKKMASGGSFIVPPGYPNDSFPLFVQSGEHVSVTAAGNVRDKISNQEVVKMLNKVNDSIQALNLNTINNNKPAQIILVTSDPTARVKSDNQIQNRLRRGNIQSEL